jgi:hypothetical protein
MPRVTKIETRFLVYKEVYRTWKDQDDTFLVKVGEFDEEQDAIFAVEPFVRTSLEEGASEYFIVKATSVREGFQREDTD